MVSKKINLKSLKTEGLEDLRIKFYAYLVFYHNHKNNYHEVSKCYKIIYELYMAHAELQENLEETMDFGFSLDKANLLENLILYLVISPHSPERQQQLL